MLRGCLVLLVCLTAWAVFSPAKTLAAVPVAAADEEASRPGQNATGHEGGAGKEEQVDIFGKALDLGIWTIVVFLLLCFVLGRFAWKPLLEGLEQRERRIHSAVEEAQRARDESQGLRDQLRKEMDRLEGQRRDLLDEARRTGQQLTEEMVAKAKADISAERERLHREVEVAKDQALQEIWAQTAQLSTLVASKAIRRQLNADDQRNLVDEALAELRQAGNARPKAFG
jgi:F-type H+-transporting ATPase subunit b